MSDISLDDLSNCLDALNLNNTDFESNNTTPKMPEINTNIFKLYADSIQVYDGSEIELEPFINAVDEFHELYHSDDIALNKCIERIIFGKLIDRARMLIGARPELNTWPLVRQFLRESFGDNRSLDILEQLLFTMTINKNETPLEFARRIQTIRSKLCFKLNSRPITELTREQKLIYIQQYESQSLKVFLRNLAIRNCDFIRARNPSTLEEAINLHIENENFTQSQHQAQNLVNKNSQTPQKQNFNSQLNANRYINKTPAIQNPNYSLQNTYVPQYQNPFQQVSSTFPSQPIPIQQRQVRQNFPTNAQTFGQQHNVFKPNPFRQNLSVPQPMSIQSRQPSINQNPNFTQQSRLTPSQVNRQFPWVKQYPTPKYTAQELHAINNESNDDYYNNAHAVDPQFEYQPQYELPQNLENDLINSPETDYYNEQQTSSYISEEHENFTMDSQTNNPT